MRRLLVVLAVVVVAVNWWAERDAVPVTNEPWS